MASAVSEEPRSGVAGLVDEIAKGTAEEPREFTGEARPAKYQRAFTCSDCEPSSRAAKSARFVSGQGLPGVKVRRQRRWTVPAAVAVPLPPSAGNLPANLRRFRR